MMKDKKTDKKYFVDYIILSTREEGSKTLVCFGAGVVRESVGLVNLFLSFSNRRRLMTKIVGPIWLVPRKPTEIRH